MPIHAHFWTVWGILTSKIGQTNLLFGVRFGSWHVHARLQVSSDVTSTKTLKYKYEYKYPSLKYKYKYPSLKYKYKYLVFCNYI